MSAFCIELRVLSLRKILIVFVCRGRVNLVKGIFRRSMPFKQCILPLSLIYPIAQIE